MNRKKTRVVKVGNIAIGGDNPIRVQSMTKTPTVDIKSTVRQIKRLAKKGCEIIRLGVPDKESALALGKIKKASPIPIVADIHFDYRLALIALEQGVDKLRLNPGNIKNPKYISLIAKEAKARGVPIRVGSNAGSLPKEILEKYNGLTPEALVESALHEVRLLEDNDFTDIVISVKASSVPLTVEAYRLLSQKVDYPLHIGITESGTVFPGTIRSSVGLGILLYEGIGDTIRVSLASSPDKEVEVAYEILDSLELRRKGIRVIACPMCARSHFPVQQVAKEIERKFKNYPLNLVVAVMGCEVNGPGEAKWADIGITGSKDRVIIFRKGKIIKETNFRNIISELEEELDKIKEVNSN
ncbi:flavodoxin-dependent (E)-4-hydroxy-3-methylbut-2-enyl-diphosphate synthase [Dictyoglomus thermophilum]|uniref:4-hydroxy-3-methylbut-2-en-1-yl diphosphate synthase (flavodoxin) n=2 Tax=Dictyoglomus thermophilum TaxID=14 RepID=B5YDA4_DICT6|nr:flavodoxin-dependent (E)-4-hydroxy-3-methylbut-2-enyl-diphosphate synthase [Dictyoglomus thermophilum]ACI18658.1 4-hydroxy-3-methylbut-2-en-1-yl diphosphate synthase [Dictyoglomus thermophilum H-6-12]MCX7721360.1 flavodoxin-dependent (E)-4-hydroxy-3-methylbut-2-enyl-diphosphate synthase [Dictyoglomus thermophilum]